MKYVTIEECKQTLFKLAIEFDLSERTPDYTLNIQGMEKLEGVLSQVQQNWYRGLFKKAAYLFISINKGHFFINGNKRLALVITLEFLYKNRVEHKIIKEQNYINWFKKEFDTFELSDNTFNRVYGWAFYNLNKAIASSHDDFHSLIDKLYRFFKFSLLN